MYAMPRDVSVGEWIRALYRDHGTALNFYRSKQWGAKRKQVLASTHCECEDCRAKSPARYSRATVVHHDRYVGKHPELALSDAWTDRQGLEHKQLHALCHECHDVRHARFKGRSHDRVPLLNDERW